MNFPEQQNEKSQAFEEEQAALYRTRWLMAHNHLHDLVMQHDQDPEAAWRAYLDELIEAEKSIIRQAA
jgi:hypothetical protein